MNSKYTEFFKYIYDGSDFLPYQKYLIVTSVCKYILNNLDVIHSKEYADEYANFMSSQLFSKKDNS